MLIRFTFVLLVVLLLSCNKDGVEETRLARMETVTAGETVTTTIQYNQHGRPVLMHALGSNGGRVVNLTTRFIRNVQGIIEKIIIKTPNYLTPFTVDSIIYHVNYSTANSRYTSMVNYLFWRNGTVEYDSVYFTYDVAGMVTQATKVINTGSSGAYQEAERNEFTYVNGNLIRCKNYLFNSLNLEQNVAYDAWSNPMGFGKEWILIGSTRNNRRFEQSSPNNAITISYNVNGSVSTTTSTYIYNLNGYPATKSDVLSNGSIQTSTYYYQTFKY